MIYPTLIVFLESLFDLIVMLPLQSMLCASDDLIENLIPDGTATILCKAQGSFSRFCMNTYCAHPQFHYTCSWPIYLCCSGYFAVLVVSNCDLLLGGDISYTLSFIYSNWKTEVHPCDCGCH